MLCQSSCAWPDSNMCVTTNLSNSLTSFSLHPPPQPLIPLTPAVVLLLQSSPPPCNPLIPPSPLPADGEHELTSDDGSSLSQSLSLPQSLQSTPAKEGITHPGGETLCQKDLQCLAVCL